MTPRNIYYYGGGGGGRRLLLGGSDYSKQVIYKGKVLKDDEVLESIGIQTGDALHIAKGMGRPVAESNSESCNSGYAGLPTDKIEIHFKGPNGTEVRSDEFCATDTVRQLRQFASDKFEVNPDEMHLLHKGRILKDDGISLGGSGVATGSVLRVARRHAGSDSTSTINAEPTPVQEAAGSPMPMAWGATTGDLEQIRTMARTLGLPLEPLEQVLRDMPPQQAMAAAMQEMARLQRGPQAGETAVQMQARWDREAADMARQVRAYLEREGHQVEEDGDELLADISRTLAEARARGAPVPNAAVFVDRSVERRRQARELQRRMAREASGLDPEIEDRRVWAGYIRQRTFRCMHLVLYT